MLTFECWMLNCCVWPQCGIAQWWISMLTWWLLNENDTNEINTDSTRSFVITHCLCSVLKLESLYSFSPTIGKQAFIVLTYRKSFILFLVMAKFKQACFAHDLSKKFHTFYTHVIFGCTRHNLNKFGSALVGTKILRSTMPMMNFECWKLSWSLRQCWILSVEFWFVGCADVELRAVRNVEC